MSYQNNSHQSSSGSAYTGTRNYPGRQRNYDPSLANEERNELFGDEDRSNRTESVSLAVDEGAFMNRTDSALDDFLLQGQSSLTNLREQRAMLKSARGRALNAANTLGVSKNLIQFINRRSTQDWYLFFAVVAITIVLIYFLFFN